MSEWVVDARGGVCNQCENEFQRLAQHWSRNQQCSYPDVGAAQHEAIRGCLVGDGNLDNPNDGPPALRIASMRRAHIEWIRDQLGWLVRGVTRDTDGAYRLRTLSHPTLGRYWTWTDGPPADWTLTKPIARLWYACDGGLEWPGSSTQPRATWTITDDAKRRACKQALAEQGYEVMVWDRRLALPFEATERFLAWVGDPTPGSEHKWAEEREEYERRRGELS
ncbi:hypothetical protein [Haloarcula argentinensis]|uniref:hypothetical protein n=2 Tax=Haloarcula TaxID=2237 RepID=UPI0002AFA41D|nr:hypothetical protein [Haloarcula argentinensis]EMA25703.1 hypothetical protein C443_02799 [Haloarcula argentinensis DSM 12282]